MSSVQQKVPASHRDERSFSERAHPTNLGLGEWREVMQIVRHIRTQPRGHQGSSEVTT